jgi:hypothetical protein
MKKGQELTLSDILVKLKEEYLSIIFLTLNFQEREKGLELKHYRYALVQKDDQGKEIKDELELWFGEHLIFLSFMPHTYIQKCIKTRQSLCRYINELERLNVLKQYPVKGKRKYRIKDGNDKFMDRLDDALLRSWFKQLADKSPNDLLKKIQEKIKNEEII